MKQPADDLFLLIRSMTASEKRYFRVVSAPYAGSREKNKYLKLFSQVDRQQEYDEPALKRFFSKDPFLGKHFKKAKNHLYHLVLAALERYEQDENAEVQALLHRSRILYRKGLYRQSGKMLAKAKKIARDSEYFTALIESAELQRNLVAANREFTTEAAMRISGDTSRYLKQEANIHHMRGIQAKIFQHFSSYHILRTAQQRLGMVQLGKLFANAPDPLSARAATILFNTMGTYYLAVGAFGKAQRNFRKAMSYNDNPRTTAGVLSHAMISSNYISACMYSGDYEKVSAEVERLLATCEKYPHNKRLRQVECSLCHTNMSRYIASGDFRDGVEFAERVKKKYFTDAIMHDKTLFAFNSAVLYFGTGNYSQVIRLTNSIIRVPASAQPAPKTAYWSRVLQVIALWENGDYDLLDYRMKAFYAFLQKRGELYLPEKIILEFIRKNYTGGAQTFHGRQLPAGARAALVRLKAQLSEALQGPGEANALEYFDFISWIDSKIRNRPFAAIIREKAMRPRRNP